MQLENILKTYGFTEKQALIYLACLELGSASVQTISRKAELPRSTCYEILESLLKEGVISTFFKKKTRHFSADDPAKLLRISREKSLLLENGITALRALYQKTSRERPAIRFYQGRTGMRTVLEEILEEARELRAIASAEDLFRALGKEFPRFVQDRFKKKIPARVILRASPKAEERKRLGPSELREVRIISEHFVFQGMIYLWEHKIAMLSFEEDMTAVIIENEALTKIQRAMFEFIWEKLSN